MKKWIIGWMMISAVACANAATLPASINYQGRLLDNAGNPVTSNVTFMVRLYGAATGGTEIFSQTLPGVEVVNGLYSFAFGSDTATFYQALEGAECWLELVVDTTVMSPRQRLVSVPYAQYARSLTTPYFTFGNGAVLKHDGYDLLLVSPDGATTSRVSTPPYSPNVAPTAVTDSMRTPTNVALVINVLTNDTDANAGDVLTITGITTPTNAAGTPIGNLVINSGNTNLTYTPLATYTGMVWFSYTISDNRGGTSQGRVGVEIYSTAVSMYMLVDISAGPTAATYPVSYRSTVPEDLLTNPIYKTTHILLRFIPKGTFQMCGASGEYGADSWDSDEIPHQVTLSKDFYMCVFEITEAQYANVMGSAAVGTSGSKRPKGTVLYSAQRGNEGNPANPPSSSSFVGKLSTKTGKSFDLPTEARWEYACRAGTTTALNNGKNITVMQGVDPAATEVAWYGEISGSYAHEVGLKQPNAWGLYDMHGNAYESCIDWWIPGTAWTSETTDPNGPDAADQYSRHVNKGSCYIESPQNLRSGDRWAVANSVAEDWYGFRVLAETN